ncbi:MAG TPA: zf-HC2 domain-containing protein, partial [Candidatus Binataceae bacterium]|nr:zf-HC2 domain-containing protein [Candidatus Binataceae bacterium]
MTCNEARPLIDALNDHELDAAKASDVEQHVLNCAACTAFVETNRALRTAIRTSEAYYRAPDHLRDRIAEAIGPARTRDLHWLDPETSIARWQTMSWRTLAIAASVGFFVMLAWNVSILSRPGRNDLADELVADHVRSLMASHLTDVASSDRHTVKPWFTGKLDFSPPVIDPASDEFSLIGGRLDYAGGREIAALVYKHRNHYINLFVAPAREEAQPISESSERGFNIARWSK